MSVSLVGGLLLGRALVVHVGPKVILKALGGAALSSVASLGSFIPLAVVNDVCHHELTAAMMVGIPLTLTICIAAYLYPRVRTVPGPDGNVQQIVDEWRLHVATISYVVVGVLSLLSCFACFS